MSDRLFVPLNKEWYNLFLAGKKKWEIRGYSSRFNEKTVKVGRDVELRKGYMKEGAIWGEDRRSSYSVHRIYSNNKYYGRTVSNTK
jgi:hypothetical protein